MKTYSWIALSFWLHLTPLSAAEQVPAIENLGLYLQPISDATKLPVYVESYTIPAGRGYQFGDLDRLLFLNELISTKNAPKNLVAALGVAVKRGKASAYNKDQALLLEQDAPKPGPDGIFQKQLTLAEFHGSFSLLAKSLSKQSVSVTTGPSRVLVDGNPLDEPTQIRFASFSGSVRDLLVLCLRSEPDFYAVHAQFDSESSILQVSWFRRKPGERKS